MAQMLQFCPEVFCLNRFPSHHFRRGFQQNKRGVWDSLGFRNGTEWDKLKLLAAVVEEEVDLHHHLVEIEGFCQVIVRAEGGGFAVADIHGSDYQDRCPRKLRVRAQLTAKFETIGRGHHQVKNKQVWMQQARR